VRWLPVVVFLATSVAFCFLPLAGRRAMVGSDIAEWGSPYRDDLGRAPHVQNPAQGDQHEAVAVPVGFFAHLRSGEWQMWDPASAAGQPSGILPISGVLSPFSAGYLFTPGWYAVGLKIFLTLLFGQAFTYLLLRRLGAGVAAATAGAVAYAFAGTGLVLMLRLTAGFVLPAILWAAHRLVERPNLRGAALLGVFTAWAWMEGFAAGFVYCAYVLAAWFVYLVAAEWMAARRREGPAARRMALQRLGWGSVAGLWALLMSLVTLVPFAVEIIDRATLASRGMPAPLPQLELLGLYSDKALGGFLPGPDYWNGLNPVESGVQAGLIVMVAALGGLLAAALGRLTLRSTGARAWPFFCVTAVVVAASVYLGGPVIAVVGHLPGVYGNPINRLRFVLNLALVVLAALSLDGLWGRSGERVGDRRRPGRVVSSLTLAFFVIVTFWQVPGFLRGVSEAGQIRSTLAYAALVAAVTAAAAGAAVLAWRRPRWVVGCAGVISLLLYVQLGVPYASFTPAVPPGDVVGIRPLHEELAALTGDSYRVTGQMFLTLPPNSSAATGIGDLRFSGLHSSEYKELLEAVNPRVWERDAFKPLLFSDEWNLRSPVLDDLAVRYFVIGTGDTPLGTLVESDTGWDSWSDPASLSASARTFEAPGPLQGLRIPVRAAGGDCDASTLYFTLRTGDDVVDVVQRPGFDLADDDWQDVAVTGDDLAGGAAVTVDVNAVGGGCRLDVGTVGDVAGARRIARQVRVPDPTEGVRVALTSQGWVYERPTARPIVTSHGRWRGYDDQEALLADLSRRPPEDAGVASFVGDAGALPASGDGPDGTVTVDRHGDHDWTLTTGATAPQLVVVSQNRARGWTATVDGEPVSTVAVDGALTGVPVPAGTHEVRLVYRPWHFLVPAAVSLVALIAALAVIAWPRRRRGSGADAAKNQTSAPEAEVAAPVS